MTTPEARARTNIDAQLAACGWVVQDRGAMNLYANRGVAVREFPLETGYADNLCSNRNAYSASTDCRTGKKHR